MTEQHSTSARIERQASPVLVVEDDPATLEAIGALLQFDGYTVVTARNSTEALHKLSGGLRPCLILLDLMLPHMDGFRFRRQQLQDAKLSQIPVAVYSGRVGAKPQLAPLGSAPYFQKPLDFDAFLNLVEAHCQRHALQPPKRSTPGRHDRSVTSIAPARKPLRTHRH